MLRELERDVASRCSEFEALIMLMLMVVPLRGDLCMEQGIPLW